MKKFSYPLFQVEQMTTLGSDLDSCIEWCDRSGQDLINQQLKGEHRLQALLPNGLYWTYGTAPAEGSTFEYLTLARTQISGAVRAQDQQVALVADRAELLDALFSALLADCYRLPSFKKDARPQQNLRIALIGPITAERVAQRLAEAEGNAYARYLTELPANELNPWSYRELVEELAEAEGWDCRVYRYKELEQMGAGAFLAVARGSAHKEASIVRIHYHGDHDSVETVSLVGKGITMDTGGYNLKTAGMFGMNADMNGSAIVLGNLLAATRRGAAVNLTGWLAIADNHIGPAAYHVNELIRALNGTTIEVVDTDAEGRMVLADTLTLASREHPKAVIDFATLTGSCVAALSTRYSGVFTNQEAWFLPLIESGKQSGERVWPFPIDADYDEHINSTVADIAQCHPGKSSDHIDAARFLSRFIEANVPWVHVDLSAAHHKTGLAHVPTAVTGFGVRFTQNLLKMLF